MKSIYADLNETNRFWVLGLIATLVLGVFFSWPTY